MWRRILTACWLVVSCHLAPCLARPLGATNLFPVWDERGRYGFTDGGGRIRIAPRFDAVTIATEGETRPCGYIDHAGQFVIKPQKEFSCRDFSEGHAPVEL
jgi:hypothetical protein